MSFELKTFFCTAPKERGKFLSRIFGVFSEEIVRCWASNPQAPLTLVGRPTVTLQDGTRHTLDFCFSNRSTGAVTVAERKCEVEYQGYRYLTLTGPEQLAHHVKPAFKAFLTAATTPLDVTVRVAGKLVQSDGAILIWGAVTPEGVASVQKQFGFRNVLSVEAIVSDLSKWRDSSFLKLLDTRRGWILELFNGLRGVACEADWTVIQGEGKKQGR
jgi:hypothetical protein